jgi:hypothetical protein
MKKENKRTPFKTVSEQLPFYPDMKNETDIHKPFVGSLVGETVLGDDPDPVKNIPVFIFANYETGEKVFIVKYYAIKKAVDRAKADGLNLSDVLFQFVFKEKTEVNGKPFNQFNTGYCSIEDYEAYEKGIEKPEKKVK